MKVEWESPDVARLTEDEGGRQATLAFDVTDGTWRVHVPTDTIYAAGHEDTPVYLNTARYVEVDYDQRIYFATERQKIAQLDPTTRAALIAELEGRINMWRDETRKLAELGARLEFRRALRNL